MADWPPLKNSAFTVTFPIYDADGDPVPAAAALDSEVSIDGGTFADVSPGEAVEIATGSGVYTLALALGEMNGDIITTITKTSTGGAKTAVNVMYTVARQLSDLAFPTVSGRSIDVAATGEVAPDFNNILGTLAAANIAADAIGASQFAADAVDEIWDELLSGHVVLGSIGQVINALGARTGAVNLGAPTASEFDTDGFVEASNNHFNGHVLCFTTGALTGQARIITTYTGALQNVAFDRAFTEAPLDNDEFVIFGPLAGGLGRLIATESDGHAHADLKEWLGVAPNALLSGRVDSSVGAMAANVVTAAAIAVDAIGSSEFAQAAADKIWTSVTRDLTALGFQLANTDFAAGAIDAAAIAADAIGASELATDAVDEIRDAVLDRLSTRRNTATAGAASTITLDAGASITVDLFKGQLILLSGGTGVGQVRLITAYSAVRVATVSPAWVTNPDATSVFNILSAGEGIGIQGTVKTFDGLNDISPAEVNAEVSDVIKTDTIPELGVGVPASTPTLEDAIMLLYMALRNKLDVDASFKEVHNDAGAVIAKKALTDDATTYSEAEMETGP